MKITATGFQTRYGVCTDEPTGYTMSLGADEIQHYRILLEKELGANFFPEQLRNKDIDIEVAGDDLVSFLVGDDFEYRSPNGEFEQALVREFQPRRYLHLWPCCGLDCD